MTSQLQRVDVVRLRVGEQVDVGEESLSGGGHLYGHVQHLGVASAHTAVSSTARLQPCNYDPTLSDCQREV